MLFISKIILHTFCRLILLSAIIPTTLKPMQLDKREVKYKKNLIRIPLLPFIKNVPTIEKEIFVQAPDKQTTTSDTQSALKNAIKTCTYLMFINDKGWSFPDNHPMFRYFNPELYTLVEKKETYFFFNVVTNLLSVHWNVGKREEWNFDQIIEIRPNAKPHLGVCSEQLIRCYNKLENKKLTVSLRDLRQIYTKTGDSTALTPDNSAKLRRKLSAEEYDAFHKIDILIMVQYYVEQQY